MNKHILWLPGWFPNRRNPFPGDFILRHAQAASLFNRITVFCTIPDQEISKQELTKEIFNENLIVYLFYYPAKKKLFSSFFNGMKRWKALKKFYKEHFITKTPDLLHVHVAWPAGLFALYLRDKYGLKYVLTEHETIYMPGYDNNRKRSALEKKVLPNIFSRASLVHAVSRSLGEALLKQQLVNRLPEIIPNVVDAALFYTGKKEASGIFRFIHISGLTYQKNPEGMLQALAEVKKVRKDFILSVIGPLNEKLLFLARELSLENQIEFKGEIPYATVADEIRKSDAMIHFSRYETFGCVVAESLSCGVPVITSDLPVTRELITDGINGWLVQEGNVNDLSEKILQFMNGNLRINAEEVAEENRNRFNYERVGRQFDEMYYRVLQPKL
jgi:glycosyltransferase involved in cell wall biosynthesis